MYVNFNMPLPAIKFAMSEFVHLTGLIYPLSCFPISLVNRLHSGNGGTIISHFYYTSKLFLGAIHKCQHFHKCTNHILSGGGAWENQHFFHILLTFWPNFYYFHWDFWHSKNVDVHYFLGVGVSESVWFVYS